METASEKPRVDIDREQRQGHNSNSVLGDEQGKGGQSQYTLLPVCGNRMRLLPTLEDPRVVVQILTHLAGRGRPRHHDEASVPRTNVACGVPALRSTGWLPARRRAASSRMKFRRR